ncbi:hypothetical protein SAMN04488109_5507 [Chryseolinea serpens]|uniref:Uncharacterized protein n=1 Tax=Chryseolinea serpens TaxID=947013 RepID=A0A1M5VXX1_9BACT|nr:hypothetical protein SAMN04488109_5507 [Chryseolinea serpens]
MKRNPANTDNSEPDLKCITTQMQSAIHWIPWATCEARGNACLRNDVFCRNVLKDFSYRCYKSGLSLMNTGSRNILSGVSFE